MTDDGNCIRGRRISTRHGRIRNRCFRKKTNPAHVVAIKNSKYFPREESSVTRGPGSVPHQWRENAWTEVRRMTIKLRVRKVLRRMKRMTMKQRLLLRTWTSNWSERTNVFASRKRDRIPQFVLTTDVSFVACFHSRPSLLEWICIAQLFIASCGCCFYLQSLWFWHQRCLATTAKEHLPRLSLTLCREERWWDDNDKMFHYDIVVTHQLHITVEALLMMSWEKFLRVSVST